MKPANSNMPALKDTVIPFTLELCDVTGRFFRSQHLISQILNRHNYPDAVARLLGEALLVTGLLASGMKLRNRMILQIQGDGAISMLMAEYTAGGTMRGYAKFDADMLARWTGGDNINPFLLLGKGHVALTVDNGADMQPYQGIVPIDGQSLSAVILKYIEQSDQIMSSLIVHIQRMDVMGDDENADIIWQGGAMILQKLGKSGEDFKISPHNDNDAENWSRACALFHTVKSDEVLDSKLSPETLLYRLFHEETVRIFAPDDVSFDCSCNAQRLKDFLSTVSQQELQNMVEQDNKIHADCQICNAKYRFTVDEISDLKT
jgi:molecular chaperone Hsp33